MSGLESVKNRLLELTNPSSSCDYLEKTREPNEFPNGLCIPFSRALQLCRSGLGRVKPYEILAVYKLLPLVFEDLDQAGLQIFESLPADISQLALTGASIGHYTTRIIPWRYEYEVGKIVNKGMRVIEKTKKPGSWMSTANGLEDIDRPQLNAQIIKTMISGPDIDGRINIAPDQLENWINKLTESFAAKIKIPNEKIEFEKTQTGFKKRIIREGIFSNVGWNTQDIAGTVSLFTPTSNKKYQSGLEFEYGVWQSGIPYVNIRFIGRSIHPEVEPDPIWIDIGLSSYPELLSEEQKKADTRTGPAIHSLNQVFLPVSTNPKSFSKFPFDELPKPQEWFDKKYFVDFGKNVPGYFEHKGIFIPVFMGSWENNKTRVPELWIILDENQLSQLNQPIKLGEAFGQKPAEETLLEFLRALRYRLRYGLDFDVSDANTSKGIRIIKGDDKFQEETKSLPEIIKNKIDAEGILSWWHIDLIREISTCLYFAPKEFIKLGKELGLDKYLTYWSLLESVSKDLPDRKTLLRTIINEAVAYKKNNTAYDLIKDFLVHKYPNTLQLKKMNALEIIFWLSSLK